MFRREAMKNGRRTLRVDLGHLLGLENAEDAYLILREMTVGEAVGWRLNGKDGDQAVLDYCKGILPDLIVDSDSFREGEDDHPMAKDAIAELLFEKFPTACLVSEEVSRFNFFILPPKSRTESRNSASNGFATTISTQR